MLESLILRGFQCHENLTIEFDPSVTVVRGENDCGKSSILRALRWITINQPGGNRFINWDSDNAVAILKVDGRKVIRKKGKAGNLYKLDGKPFHAFGAGKVPDEIANLLRIDDTCFQRQHSAPHLFFSTPGQVARELNRVIALDEIDQTLANAAQTLRKSRNEAEAAESRLNAANSVLDALEWVRRADRKLKSCEELSQRIEESQTKQQKLSDLLDKLAYVSKIQERTEQELPLLQKALKAKQEVNEYATKTNRLRQLLSKLSEAKERAQTKTNQADEARVEQDRLSEGKCPICGRDNEQS